MQILIASSGPMTQQMLRTALVPLECDVVSAADGAEAWRAVQLGDHLAVIVEQDLPGVDGLELCRRIRQDANIKPVYLAILAHTESREDLLAALAAGANDHLVYPVDGIELCARINSAAGQLIRHREAIDRALRLEVAAASAKRLEGIISVCAHCKRLRDGGQNWVSLEDFINTHTDAVCSHGICPDCTKTFFAEPPLDHA